LTYYKCTPRKKGEKAADDSEEEININDLPVTSILPHDEIILVDRPEKKKKESWKSRRLMPAPKAENVSSSPPPPLTPIESLDLEDDILL
jgi:hypothetical protein